MEVSVETRPETKKDASVAQNTLLKSLLSSKIRTLLIKGEPGAGKTTLALELMAGFGSGIYVSSRVSQDMLMEQNPQLRELAKRGLVSSVSMSETDEKPKSFKFEDYRLASIEDVLISILGRPKDSNNGDLLIVLDSWDSIVNKLDAAERMKTEQSLLVIAEANNVKLIFVSEEERLTASDYFVDAVVKLEEDLMDGMRVRRLVWKKLRGSVIPHRSSLYTLDNGRVTIFDPTVTRFVGEYVSKKFNSIPNTLTRYSSGSRDFDNFLEGGFRRGSNIVVEMDNRIGSTWHVPLIISCELNFLSNRGSLFIIPSANYGPQTVKQNILPYFDEETLQKSLRVAHYDPSAGNDPCFLELDRVSVEKTREAVERAIRTIKGPENRPCLFLVGMDTVHSATGQEILDPLGVGLTGLVRQNNDLLITTIRQGSALTQDMNSDCDLHLKLEELDRTLVIRSLKPPSELYHLGYDYSPGYGQVMLKPIV